MATYRMAHGEADGAVRAAPAPARTGIEAA
jgi:hypothetical protein